MRVLFYIVVKLNPKDYGQNKTDFFTNAGSWCGCSVLCSNINIVQAEKDV